MLGYDSSNVSISRIALRTVIGPYGYSRQLLREKDLSEKIELEHLNLRPISSAFPKVVAPRMEFDVAELALVTYFLAKRAGRRISALPIFLLGGFPFDTIVHSKEAGISSPRDLAGKRVGCGAISQTTGVWLRGILEQEHGLAFDDVTWVVTRKEHLPEFVAQGRIEERYGAELKALLAAKEIDAFIGFDTQEESEEARLLFPDHRGEAARFHQKYDYYPINHTIVVRNELLEQHPWLAGELVQMFRRARQNYFDQLMHREPEDAIEKKLLLDRLLVGADLLEVGMERNRAALDALAHCLVKQRIAETEPDLAQLFIWGEQENGTAESRL
jgi:4,5-dihydroxyphthalate decarboxylase